MIPTVIPGLDPGIHTQRWCLDGRVKPGHDGQSCRVLALFPATAKT